MRAVIYEIDKKNNAGAEGMTIRQAVEWWKEMFSLGNLTVEESEYVDGRWGYIMQIIASREGLPVSWLSYLVAELAYQEQQLLETAVVEGAIALATGDNDEQTQETNPLPSIPGTTSEVG